MINYVQHIAIGVKDIEASYRFYRDILGFRGKFIDDHVFPIPETYLSSGSSQITRDHQMRILFAFHPQGGASVELAVFNDITPVSPENKVQIGDIGFIELGVRVRNLEGFVSRLKSDGNIAVTPVLERKCNNHAIQNFAFIRDPDGTLIELVETRTGKGNEKPSALGIEHLGIGVRNLEASEDFYVNTLKIGKTLAEWEEKYPDLTGVAKRDFNTRNILIGTEKDKSGQLRIINQSKLKLIQAMSHDGSDTKTNRRWGDIGIMELAMDTGDIAGALAGLKAGKVEVSENPTYIKLGAGSHGYFAFVADPDGNLIELVEIRKLLHMPPQFLSAMMFSATRAIDGIREISVDFSPYFSMEVRERHDEERD